MQFLCYFPKRVCMSNIYIYSEVFDPSYQLFASMSMSLKVSSIHETYFAVFLIKNNNIRKARYGGLLSAFLKPIALNGKWHSL